MLGGVVMYATDIVAHSQYIATTTEGRLTGALSAILDHLIEEIYSDYRYFDLGISTDQSGTYLNPGLQQNKESYGARAVVYDFHNFDIAGASSPLHE